MPNTIVNANNKLAFKNYIRSNSWIAGGDLVKVHMGNILEMFNDPTYPVGLSSSAALTPVKYVNVGSGGTVSIRNRLFESGYLYLPGIQGDTITVKVGTGETTFSFHNFTGDIENISLNEKVVVGNVLLKLVKTGGALFESSTYNVNADRQFINEGELVEFTVRTQNVGIGSTLYYSTNSSDMTAADFTDNSTTGQFEIEQGTSQFAGIATITRTVSRDPINEGTNSFSLVIREGSTSGLAVTESLPVSVTDIPATFSISESTTSINEGESVTLTVTTTEVTDGTTLFFTTGGGQVVGSDFSDAVTFGTVTINSNTGTITRTVARDAIADGTESFSIIVRTESISGTAVTESQSISIGDIVPTNDITPSVTSINEGDSVTFTVNTTAVPNGTTLYFSTGGDMVADDFQDNTLTGSFTITADANEVGSATITRIVAYDDPAAVESNEFFNIVIRADSPTGTALTTSSNITVSNVDPTYSIDPLKLTVAESETVNFEIYTTDVSDGTTLYYSTNFTNLDAADFDTNTTGSFSIVGTGGVNGIGTVTVTPKLDQENEANGEFSLVIRTGSTTGTAVTESQNVQVTDAPLSAVITTSVGGVSTTHVREGETLDITINTTNVDSGTDLYWVMHQVGGVPGDNTQGWLGSSEFESGIEGSFNIIDLGGNSGVATISKTAAYSYAFVPTEIDENFIINVAYGATDGTVIGTSETCTVVNVDTVYRHRVEINNVVGGYVTENDIVYVNEGDKIRIWLEADYFEGSSNSSLRRFQQKFVTIQGTLDLDGVSPSASRNSPIPYSSGRDTSFDDDFFESDYLGSRSSSDASDIGLSGDAATEWRNRGAIWNDREIQIYRDYVKEDEQDIFQLEYYDYDTSQAGNLGVFFAKSPKIAIIDYPQEVGGKSDGVTFGPLLVNRDDGNESLITDWFNLCKVDELPDGSTISLFIDTSGSMTLNTVKASYDAFVAKCNEKNITIAAVVENSNEDWITPFL